VQVIVNDEAVSRWKIDEQSRQMVAPVSSHIVAKRGVMHITFQLAEGAASSQEANRAHIILEEIRLEVTEPRDLR
jgi:hypothetical protein